MISLPKARYILPNLFTLSAAFCGFAAIWLATQASTSLEFYAAASLICLAVFLDGFDGRIARRLDAQSKIGVQLDSLSDFLTFGAAPGVLAYAWGLANWGVPGLLLAFLLPAGAMIRLARFNVEAETTGGSSKYFEGLPAPMAGLSVALVVGVSAGTLGRAGVGATATTSFAVLIALLSLLMVSTIPFRTFKDMRPTWRNRLLLAAVLATQVVVSVSIDYTVALALPLFAYVALHLVGGVIGSAVKATRNVQRDGTLVESDWEDDDWNEDN